MTDQHTTTGPAAQSVPSRRAPDARHLRRPSNDPTLNDGSRTPTTPAWAPTPTLTDRRVLHAPALVVAEAPAEKDSPGARVAAVLERLGRPVAVVPPGTVGAPAGAEGLAVHPLVVHVGSAEAIGQADAVRRTVAAFGPGTTITYDAAAGAGTTGDAREVVEELVARADVVRVATRDLDALYPGEEHRDAVGRWLRAGPSIVVVSGGAAGAWAVNAVGVTATSTTAVAADDDADAAFMAGVIDALWKGGLLGGIGRPDLRTLVQGSLRELVDHGSAAAALTASGGTVSREELMRARGVPRIEARRTT